LRSFPTPSSAPLFPVTRPYPPRSGCPQLEAAEPTRGRESPVRVHQHNRAAPSNKLTNVQKAPEIAFLKIMLQKGHENASNAERIQDKYFLSHLINTYRLCLNCLPQRRSSLQIFYKNNMYDIAVLFESNDLFIVPNCPDVASFSPCRSTDRP
jgi:hypothetical protein